jgi:hypothetical protein
MKREDKKLWKKISIQDVQWKEIRKPNGFVVVFKPLIIILNSATHTMKH